MITNLDTIEAAEKHLQALRNDIDIKNVRRAIFAKNIAHLDPIIFKAKFTSISHSLFSAFQHGGTQMCIKFVDKLNDLSENNATFVISYEANGLQYIPSLLISLAISPPCIDALVSVLRCLSTLTTFSFSRRFTKEEFLHFLCEKIKAPVTSVLPRVNISVLNSKNDPVLRLNTPEEIQKFSLKIILNLLKKYSISFETAASVGLFDAIFSIGDGPNSSEVMKILNVCFDPEIQEEVNEEILQMSFELFAKHALSQSTNEQAVAFDGLARLIQRNPEVSSSVSGSEIIDAAYEQMHNTSDSILISSLTLLSSILATEDESEIASVCRLINWSNFKNLWDAASLEQKQMLCEFINTLISADPKQIVSAFNEGVFEIMADCLSQDNYALETETFLPVITALSINPNLMASFVLEKGIMKIAARMMETTDKQTILYGLKFVESLITFESNPEIEEAIKNQIDDNGISSDIESLTTVSDFADEANEVSADLLHFMESSDEQ